MVVVFPAPFGPRNPTICPFSTVKDMLSTAVVRPYRLVRPSTLIIGVDRNTNRRNRAARSPDGKWQVHINDKDGAPGLSNRRALDLRA